MYVVIVGGADFPDFHLRGNFFFAVKQSEEGKKGIVAVRGPAVHF